MKKIFFTAAAVMLLLLVGLFPQTVKADETSLNSTALFKDAGIKTGYYRILSGLSDSRCMDIADGSKANDANLELGTADGSASQIFYVLNRGDGTYTIRNANSMLALDIEQSSTEKGANVRQHRVNGSEAQTWYIGQSTSDGYAFVQSVYTDFVLDVEASSTADGTNIRMWKSNRTAAQRWKFEKADLDASLSAGYYKIASSLDTGKVLDVAKGGTEDKTNIQLYAANGSAAQVFYISPLGEGLYECMACNAGKMLDAAAGRTANGTNVDLYRRNDTEAQEWYILKNPADGTMTIAASKDPSAVLDAAAGKTDNGTNIQLYRSNGTGAQKWKITQVSEPQVTLADGMYTMTVSLQTKMVIDIKAGSKASGANVQIYTANNSNAQKFNVKKLADGNYSIQNVGSGMMLDVAASGTADKTNVQQYKPNGTAAQEWMISGCPGRYKIASAVSGKLLDVAGGVMANGTNVWIYHDNETRGQRFLFTPTVINAEEAAKAFPVDKGIYRITTALDPSLAVEVPGDETASYAEGLQMQISASDNTDQQKFQLQKTADGYYLIMNVHTGLVLTAKATGGSTWGAVSGTTAVQYNEIESDMYKNYQKWSFVINLDGTVSLRNYTGYYLNVIGGAAADGTKLNVLTGNAAKAQRFYFTKTETTASLRTHGYATDPVSGKSYWVEGTFWTDPSVSETEFLAAAIYAEGGSQGLAGTMMIGYSMLNSLKRQGISSMRYVIYQYGQYEICRVGVLTDYLTMIKNGDTSAMDSFSISLQAAQNCMAGKDIKLQDTAVITYANGSGKKMTSGSVLKASDFTLYDGFMTPAAMTRHGFTTAGHNTVSYKAHVYYVESEMWG